jgi:bifunctional DNase/RNase
MKKIQVDILGLSTSPANNGAYALILFEVGGKRKLPIIIGAFEAQAIALELEKIKPPRPLTHDLIRSFVDSFNISVTSVVIDELKEGTFYAKIHSEMAGVVQEIDSRPSDAIAVAVRCEAPIFVSEEVMDEAGILDDREAAQGQLPPAAEKKQLEAQAKSPVTKLDGLMTKLSEAIQNEDYEKAARLRDEISKLKSSS